MKIALAGGSGFLGTALTQALTRDGHDVAVLTRQNPASVPPQPRVTHVAWKPDGTSGTWAAALDGADAVVNLAGESIAARRWSDRQKQEIRESRLRATTSLTAAIRQVARAPKVLVSGSAVGYYGDRGDETITESSAPGKDFLAGVAEAWENAADQVADLTRVALIRTGIVLDRNGGALAKMLPPFQLCVGGPLGSGRQYMPWIHKDGLGTACDMDDDARRRARSAERHQSRTGDECGILEGARTRIAPPQSAARARLCAAPRAGRNGRRAAAGRTARASGARY